MLLCYAVPSLNCVGNLKEFNVAKCSCDLSLTLFWVKSRYDPLISGMQLTDLDLVFALV